MSVLSFGRLRVMLGDFIFFLFKYDGSLTVLILPPLPSKNPTTNYQPLAQNISNNSNSTEQTVKIL